MGESHTERRVVEIIHHPETIQDMAPKIAKTSNATGFSTYSGNYGNNLNETQTIKIDGATSLLVDFAYQTEGTSYDYLLIIDSSVKYGGTTLKRKSLTITGDTVTFTFKSDSSNGSYLGYYAEVVGLDADGNVLQETVPAWDEEVYGDVEVPHVYKPRDMASAITSIGSKVVFPGSIDNPYSRWNENWMPQLNKSDFYTIPSDSYPYMTAYFLLEFEPEVVAAGNAKVQYHKATGYSTTVTGRFFTFDGTEKTLKYNVTSSNTNYLYTQTLTEEEMYLTPEGKYQIYFYVPQNTSSSASDILQLAYGYDNYDYTIKAMTYVYCRNGSAGSSNVAYTPLLYNPNIFPQSPCIEHIDTYLTDDNGSSYMLPYYASYSSNALGRNPSAIGWMRCKGFNLRAYSSATNSNIIHMSSRTSGLIVDNDVVTFRLDKCSASKILIDGSENYTPYTYADKKMINFAGATHDRMFFTTSSIYVPATYRMFIDFSNFDYQGTSATFYIYVETSSGIVQWEYLVESLKTLKLPNIVTTKTVRVDKYNYYNLHTNYPELEAKLIEMGFTLYQS